VDKTRSIQKYFVKIDVKELDWPAQSPDLNPIKHLSDELEHLLRAKNQCPTSLMLLCLNVRKQVPAAMFQHLVESLPSRVEVVITAKGRPTPYYCP
jgi:hypothetical protein